MSSRGPRIVVGVGDQRVSRDALRWAFAQAALTGRDLHVIRAWHISPGGGVVAELPGAMVETGAVPSSLPPSPTVHRALREAQDAELKAADQKMEAVRRRHEREAERVLDATIAAALGGEHDDVRVVRDVIEGGAPEVLVAASAGADLLVLGCRGRGPLSEAVLGSVGRHCARHAPCPVVIVPAGVRVERPRAGGERPAGAHR